MGHLSILCPFNHHQTNPQFPGSQRLLGHLQPCIAVEYRDQIHKLYTDMWHDDNMNYGTFDVRVAAYDFLARTHCILFKRPLDYSTFDLPCVVASLDWSVPFLVGDRSRVINTHAIKYYQKPVHKTRNVFPPNFLVELTKKQKWQLKLRENWARGWGPDWGPSEGPKEEEDSSEDELV
jgi:hypothetical protein